MVVDAVRTWIRRSAVITAVTLIALQWANSRIAILRVNQNADHPMIMATLPVYLSMATGLREGRIGQIDLPAVSHYYSRQDLSAVYERLTGPSHQWVSYYTLDIGYGFIVEAARLAFPALPDSHLRPLALQLLADLALVGLVFALFAQWNVWLGLAATSLYVANGEFQELVSFAFYYFWDVPIAFVVTASMAWAWRRQNDAGVALSLAAATLAIGVWLRASWWPLALVALVVAVSSHPLRRRLWVPIAVFAVIAAPQVVRASSARHWPAFSTRTVWHVALVGLGYYPNPYGLAVKDTTVFDLTRRKYGVPYRLEDYERHDRAARTEFFRILRTDPKFVLGSMMGRLGASFLGTTESSVPSLAPMTNPVYRLICWGGLIAMFLRRGERRFLGLLAAGWYVVYVTLTSLFFYVGMAYDNVSEVALFIGLIGAIDAAVYTWRRLTDCDDPWGVLTV
jgi:hypothetical protein